MKMKWKEGLPHESGYYLVWNPAVDSYPTVMHYESGGVGWWTYRVHEAVLRETIGPMLYEIVDNIVNDISDLLKLNKKQIGTLRDFFQSDDRLDYREDVANQAISEACANVGSCIYDEHYAKESFWSPVPYLWDGSIDDDVQSMVSTGESSPNVLNIEVEDMRAALISSVADAASKALSAELTKFDNPVQSPWSRHE